MTPVTEFDHPDHGWKWRECELEWINRRIAAEVAAEREACAKVCDSIRANRPMTGAGGLIAEECAVAIRMRSNG